LEVNSTFTCEELNCFDITGNRFEDIDVYIKEVKYRRNKNDIIRELEAKDAEREAKNIQILHLAEEGIRCIEFLRREEKTEQQYTQLMVKMRSGADLREFERLLLRFIFFSKRRIIERNGEFENENKQLREKIEDLKLDLKNNVSVIAEPIPECECSCLKAQVQSLKLQLTAEKRISQKYMHDLQQRDKHQAILTAM
jgi:hypothetical protein